MSENQQMERDEHGASGGEPSQAAGQSTADDEKVEKEDRACLGAERRAKIMAQLASARKNSLSSTAEHFKATTPAVPWNGNTIPKTMLSYRLSCFTDIMTVELNI